MALVVKIFLLLLAVIAFSIHNAALHKTRKLSDYHKVIPDDFDRSDLLSTGALNIPVLVNIYNKGLLGSLSADVGGFGLPPVVVDLALVTSPLFSAIVYLWAASIIFWIFNKFTRIVSIVIFLLFVASIALYFVQGKALFRHEQASFQAVGLASNYDDLVSTSFNLTSQAVRAMMKGVE